MVATSRLIVLVVAAAGNCIVSVLAARIFTEHGTLDRNSPAAIQKSTANLCDKWLLVRYVSDVVYNEDVPELGGYHEGAYKLTSWDEVVLFDKSHQYGTKRYTANCKKGAIVIETTRRSDQKTVYEERPLQGWFRSKKSIVRSPDVVTLHEELPDFMSMHLTGSGEVSWLVIDPRPALDLTSISDSQQKDEEKKEEKEEKEEEKDEEVRSWDPRKAVPGCYCCKHFYAFPIGADPFTEAGSHKAFFDDECMLAWSTYGATYGTDMERSNSDYAYELVNLMSAPKTQKAACSLTCPFRSDMHAANKYSYLKLTPINMEDEGNCGIRLQRAGGTECLQSGGPGKKMLSVGEGSCASFVMDGLTLKSLQNPGQCLDVFGGRDLGLWSCHGRRNQQFHRNGSTWCSGRTCVELNRAPKGASCQCNSQCASGHCEGAEDPSSPRTCQNKAEVASVEGGSTILKKAEDSDIDASHKGPVIHFKTAGGSDCLQSNGQSENMMVGEASGKCASFEVEGTLIRSLESPGQCLDASPRFAFGGARLGVGLGSCYDNSHQFFQRVPWNAGLLCSGSTCVESLLPMGASCAKNSECGSKLCEGGSGQSTCQDKAINSGLTF